MRRLLVWLEKKGALVVIITALILAIAGQVPKADNVTHRVLDLVADVKWTDLYKPFLMPFPIDAMAFRPISVLIFKSHVELFGVGPPAIWLALIKSFLSVGLFGLAARNWLIAVGFTKHATLATVLSMVSGPALFQVWYYPELDLLGAAATLWVGSSLIKATKLSLLRWVGVGLALTFSMLLKEASALIQLAFLGSAAVALWETNPRLRNRHIITGIVATIAWGILVLPLLSGPETTVGALTLPERLPVVEHNFAQALYLLSPAGIILLLLGALARAPIGRRSMGVVTNLPVISILALCAAPIVTFYSHYEAVYYSPRWFGLLFGGLFAVGLIISSITRRKEERARLATYTLALSFIGMSLVGLIAPTAREDLAARIFIALAPIMFAMALSGLDLITEVVRLKEGWQARVGELSCVALLVTMVWHPTASGLNYTTDYRARHGVDVQGKRVLSNINVGDGLVMFNHYVEWLEPLGLIAAGADESVRQWEFMQVPAWLELDDYPDARWIHPGRLDLLEHIRDREVWLYWLSARSRMDNSANEALVGELSWTRRNFGLFTPVISGGHNRPEDHRLSIYTTETSPLEQSFSQNEALWNASGEFIALPLNVTEVFRRVLSGLPIIEKYEYTGALIKR